MLGAGPARVNPQRGRDHAPLTRAGPARKIASMSGWEECVGAGCPDYSASSGTTRRAKASATWRSAPTNSIPAEPSHA